MMVGRGRGCSAGVLPPASPLQPRITVISSAGAACRAVVQISRLRAEASRKNGARLRGPRARRARRETYWSLPSPLPHWPISASERHISARDGSAQEHACPVRARPPRVRRPLLPARRRIPTLTRERCWRVKVNEWLTLPRPALARAVLQADLWTIFLESARLLLPWGARAPRPPPPSRSLP